jgi:hypothetical protein
MKAIGCTCAEMLEMMKTGPTYNRYDKSMAMTWECPKHGKVSADYRTPEQHLHPPSPHIPEFQVTRPNRRNPGRKYLDRRVRA